MVDVVLLCREHGPAGVELAVRGALTAGAIDGRAVAPRAEHRAGRAWPADRPVAASGSDHPPDTGPDRIRPTAWPGGPSMTAWHHYSELNACIETQIDWTGVHVIRRF